MAFLCDTSPPHVAPDSLVLTGVLHADCALHYPHVAEPRGSKGLIAGVPVPPRSDCGSPNVLFGCAHPSILYRWCPCGRRFSVCTGNAMADSKLIYRTWALAICLLTACIKRASPA